jgi:hypothetical protein
LKGNVMEEDIVRPELNLEKWPGIWQPARSNSKLNEIVLERRRVDGISKIEITANSKYGAMTTETQKVMYALCKISEKKGHPRRIYFSCSKIAKILKKQWGKPTATLIRNGLYQLRFTAFILKDAFYDALSKNRVKSFVDTFTILSVLKVVEEEIDGHITKEECYCEFNEYIYNNLVNNYVKPVLLDTFLSFGDDGIAQLLYTHLDLMLSKSNEYRRLSKEVFCNELKALGKEYQHLSRRKRTIERIESKLNGKKLSSGGFLKLWLEKSPKGNDYDLVATKVEMQENPTVSYENKEIKKEYSKLTQVDKSKIEKLAKAIPPNLRRKSNLANENVGSEVAKELVQYFHKKFFNLENVNANSKELKQANELVKEYGFTISKYIIEYAYNQAAETNYKIGQFGAVLEYAGRGAVQHEKDLKRKEYIEKLESCPFCNGLIYVDVMAIGNGKEPLKKFKCPHDLEKLKATAREKRIKLRLGNGQFIDFQNE